MRSARSGRFGGISHLALPLIVGLLALTACESGPEPAEQLADEAAVPTAAMGFFDAMERRDFSGAKPFASAATQEYLDVTDRFFAMLAEMEDFDDVTPPGEARLDGVLLDGDKATVVVLSSTEGEDGPEEERLALLLVREEAGWGVYGVHLDGEPEPNVFADRLEEAKAMVAETEKERAGHPELAPVVRGWVEAVIDGDFEAAEAFLTSDCATREKDAERSFTNGFRQGAYRIERWDFGRADVEGDEGRQIVRTILRLADGETDGEPLRFRCVRTTTGWRIAEID